MEQHRSIVEVGRNTWRRIPASRAAILVDASEYYRRLDQVLRRAERSVLIIAWGFDGSIRLCPDDAQCLPLAEFLRSLVEAKPDLEIRILVWSAAVLHAQGASLPLLLGADWQDHPRIHIKLDQQHPIHAAHHQKIVVLDDTLAFAGGIDLTVQRWDTCEHKEQNEYRIDGEGKPYPPVHDLQMAVSGEAAAALGDLARERWHAATKENLARSPRRTELWPEDLEPDFRDVQIGISRTAPAHAGAPPVREIAELTQDLFKVARESIYIESQYFSAAHVRKLLQDVLAKAAGAEVVVVTTAVNHGPVERWIMGENRDRMLRALHGADKYGRLRVYHPVVRGRDRPCDVLIHSKLAIVDGRILRVGSANLNNRSMGLDTECDLTIEAANEIERRAIANIRDRLLGEHLDATTEQVASAVARERSLVRAIERLNQRARGLRPFAALKDDGPTEPVLGTGLLDPRDRSTTFEQELAQRK